MLLLITFFLLHTRGPVSPGGPGGPGVPEYPWNENTDGFHFHAIQKSNAKTISKGTQLKPTLYSVSYIASGKVICIPEPGNFCLWNPEFWPKESVIQLKEWLESGIQVHWQGIPNPVPGVQNSRLTSITLSYVQTNATTPNIVAPTMLRIVGSVLQWCAHGCNNSQQHATGCTNGRNM